MQKQEANYFPIMLDDCYQILENDINGESLPPELTIDQLTHLLNGMSEFFLSDEEYRKVAFLKNKIKQLTNDNSTTKYT